MHSGQGLFSPADRGFSSRHLQKNPKDTSPVRLAFHRDSPAMCTYYPQENVQAHAPIVEGSREKWIEDLLDISIGNPSAGIFNFQTDMGNVFRLPVVGDSDPYGRNPSGRKPPW
jgi:hypothetical protein